MKCKVMEISTGRPFPGLGVNMEKVNGSVTVLQCNDNVQYNEYNKCPGLLCCSRTIRSKEQIFWVNDLNWLTS